MLFLGYWSLWFLIGLFLSFTKRIRFTIGRDNNQFSFVSLIVFSAILALPSSLVHCTFVG